MKKLRLFILILFMIFTVLPVSIKAEGDTLEPDVTVYATKEQLMDGTFAPDSDGVAKNIGKIIFGKNSSGNSQEWYILGADSGVNDGKNNTIIFAASPIATGQVFENDRDNNKTDSSLWSDCDYSGTSITEVYPNHYGASDLRVTLKAMATNTSYFTSAEQGMLNETTVATIDWNNGGKAYTTTDKLYALAADDYGEQYKTIKAGSNNQILLLTNDYWYIGNTFWLRSPFTSYESGYKLIALSGYIREGFVGTPTVNMGHDIRPASNLNLTNVLFASTAMAGCTGELVVNFVMDLRLDGSDKGLGSATVYSDHIEIKNGTNNNVALIVQGKNGTINWAYSKYIPTDGSVNKITKTDIIDDLTALNITDIDLSKCKVWLETTGNDKMIYAVEANTITEINIDVDAPEPLKALDNEISTDTDGISIEKFNWDKQDDPAKFYETYTISVELEVLNGFKLGKNVKAKINGNEASLSIENNILTVTYTFDYTDKDVFVKAYDPASITVPNGTSLEEIKKLLPTEVKIETEGQGELDRPVSWNPNGDLFTKYDPNKKDEQTFTIQGGINLGESISYMGNDVAPGVWISVTISAAEIVPTPTPITPVTDDGYVVPNTGVK